MGRDLCLRWRTITSHHRKRNIQKNWFSSARLWFLLAPSPSSSTSFFLLSIMRSEDFSCRRIAAEFCDDVHKMLEQAAAIESEWIGRFVWDSVFPLLLDENEEAKEKKKWNHKNFKESEKNLSKMRNLTATTTNAAQQRLSALFFSMMTNKKNKSFRHRVRPLSQLSVGLSTSRKKYIRSTREKLLDVLEGKIEFHSILPLSRRESSWLQREECSHRCLAGQLEAEINQRQIEIDRKWPKKKQQLFFEALVPLKRARKKWNRERREKKKSSHKKKSAERRRRKVKLIYHLVSTHLSLSFSLCSEVWLPPHTESRPEKKSRFFMLFHRGILL